MQYEERIRRLQEEIDRAKNLKIRSEARLEQLNIQRSQLLDELKELHIKPDELEDEIKGLEQKIEMMLTEAESLLPKDSDD